jgi:hypothetical protein
MPLESRAMMPPRRIRGDPCNPRLLFFQRRSAAWVVARRVGHPRHKRPPVAIFCDRGSSALAGAMPSCRCLSLGPASRTRPLRGPSPPPSPVHCGRHTGARWFGHSSRDQRPRGRHAGVRTRRAASRRRPVDRPSLDDATAIIDLVHMPCKPRTTMKYSERITATRTTRHACAIVSKLCTGSRP